MERGSWTRQPKRPACQGRVVTCTAIHPKLLRQAQKRRKKTEWDSCAAGPLQAPERPAKHAERQKVGMRLLVSRKEQTTPGIRWSPTQILIWRSKALSEACLLGYEGSKNRGFPGPKTGASSPLLVLSVSLER